MSGRISAYLLFLSSSSKKIPTSKGEMNCVRYPYEEAKNVPFEAIIKKIKKILKKVLTF